MFLPNIPIPLKQKPIQNPTKICNYFYFMSGQCSLIQCRSFRHKLSYYTQFLGCNFTIETFLFTIKITQWNTLFRLFGNIVLVSFSRKTTLDKQFYMKIPTVPDVLILTNVRNITLVPFSYNVCCFSKTIKMFITNRRAYYNGTRKIDIIKNYRIS